MRLVSALFCFAVLTAATAARAQEPEHPTAVEAVHFTFTADEGCPSKAEFTDLLAARGASFLDSDSATRTLDVMLRHSVADPATWNGSMRVVDASENATRTTTASSCAELARSLAIFTSLALNPPPTMLAPPPTTVAPPPPPPAKPPSPPAPTIPRPPPPPAPPPATSTTESPPFHRGRWFLGARGAFVLPLGSRFEQWGAGISARRFVAERWALGADVDLYFPPENPSPTEPRETTGTRGNKVFIWPSPLSEIGARSLLTGDFVLGRAHGTIERGGFHLKGSPIDLIAELGLGALWTRPIPRVDPTFRSFPWAPRPAAQAVLDEAFTAYLDDGENPNVAPTEQLRANGATWYDVKTFRTAIGVHLGLELATPGSTTGSRK